jgi:hypothetical protein
MAVVYPHTFHDGVNEQASGSQVMDNFIAIKNALEALEAAVVGNKPTTYTARANRLFGTEYENNTSRPWHVIVNAAFAGATGDYGYANVTVAGALIAQLDAASITGTGVSQTVGFYLWPGQRYRVDNGRNGYELFESRAVL